MALARTLPLKQTGYVSLNSSLVFSVLLHLAALALLLFASLSSSPSPQWTLNPVYSVQLVNSPDFSGKTKNPSDFAKEISEPAPNNRPVVMKKEMEDVSSRVAIKNKLQKQQDMHLERVLDKIRRRVALKGGQASASKAPNSSNQPTRSEVNARMNEYYAMVWMRIKERWALPQSMPSNKNLEAIINVRIMRNGEIAELRYEKSSGSKYFDDSALRAIRKANPLPPLPAWIPDKSIEVGIVFHGSEAEKMTTGENGALTPD
jgi:TonB family protein